MKMEHKQSIKQHLAQKKERKTVENWTTFKSRWIFSSRLFGFSRAL